MKTVRRLLLVLVAIGVVVAIYLAMKPQPIKVDLATIGRGTLQVSVDEDGKTRIKERYVVSAPLSGRLLRIGIDPGDIVEAKKTELAAIEPTDPQLLNPRELASAEAREKAAEAALKRAAPALASAKADLQYAESELARIRKLHNAKAMSESRLQESERAYRMSAETYRSSAFAQDIARFELEQAQAALVPSRKTVASGSDGSGEGASETSDWRFKIESPIRGKVLRVFQESSAVVAPGAPLLEVGDPTDLELEIDVLSSDAVQIRPGQNVIIEHWGGVSELNGVVRLVEPSAFTKISALGVEEQRVNAIVDIVNPVNERETLGDGFRVEVKIVVWEGNDLLLVPMSCLFREDNDWLVFLDRGGAATKCKIEIGHRNSEFAEVNAGLTEDDVVVMHPGDNIADGVSIIARDE